MRAIRVDGEPMTGFSAFLDGTQRSHVATYVRGLPIVYGTVAAVVRERRLRRLTTWGRGPSVEHVLCAPRAFLLPDEWAAIEALDVELFDSSVDDRGALVGPHPFALVERAKGLVQYRRELREQTLAERWCNARAPGHLFVDGGLSGSEQIARAECTVGVVKSHRTLHAEAEAANLLFALRRGWRSSVFSVSPAQRTAVASWYLRLRDADGRDPLFGLVRVEVAAGDHMRDSTAAARRANDVSRWILAEAAAPLALPDARWDKMVYGIRDCEEYLRAVC
jgi:hypothetical protein